MFEFRRFLWVLTILAFLITATGCSSYGVVHGPGNTDSLPPAVDWTRIVESGDKVRVTYEDDRTIEGQVVDLSPDSFVVETKVKRLVEPKITIRRPLSSSSLLEQEMIYGSLKSRSSAWERP